MKTDLLNQYGQVEDSTIAEGMANIEKPFRETPIKGLKKIFTSKTRQIIKGEKLGEKYAETIFNSSEYQQKMIEKEEKRQKEKEELWARENPEDVAKLAKYKEYLETIPTVKDALELIKKFAIKANEERSENSYITYKKSRRLFYEFFIKNNCRTNKYIEQLLLMPSDWKSTEDDEYFLRELRKYDKNTEIYGGYGYISIYRIGNKFNIYSNSGIVNKSLAVRMIIDYANHSGYTNMSEHGTEGFILGTLGTSLLTGEKDWGLIPCTPLDELENTSRVFDSHNGTKYKQLISKLKEIQQKNLEMDKTQYQQNKNELFAKKIKEEFERIAKQEENKIKQEEEEEKRKLEEKKQEELRKKQLKKQEELKKELLAQ